MTHTRKKSEEEAKVLRTLQAVLKVLGYSHRQVEETLGLSRGTLSRRGITRSCGWRRERIGWRILRVASTRHPGWDRERGDVTHADGTREGDRRGRGNDGLDAGGDCAGRGSADARGRAGDGSGRLHRGARAGAR